LENPRKPTPQEIRVMQMKLAVRTEVFRREMLKRAAAFKLEIQATSEL